MCIEKQMKKIYILKKSSKISGIKLVLIYKRKNLLYPYTNYRRKKHLNGIKRQKKLKKKKEKG